MNVACTQCGTPSVRGNRFCGRCGSPLPPSTGNLPTSTVASSASAPTPTPATTGTSPCWQCGGPVDPVHQLTCANCGARLVAGPPTVGAAPPVAVGVPMPPPAGAPAGPPVPPPVPARTRTPFDTDAATAQIAKEPLLSGAALTLIVAILIVLALAVAGIVAGQAI